MAAMIRTHAAVRERVSTLALVMIAAALQTGCGAAKRSEPTAPPLVGIEALVREHAALYPAMEPEDLYKLIRQATLGPQSLFVGQNSELEDGLSQEIARMNPSPIEGEPLVEMLDPDWNLVRINLRPWLQRGGTMEDLARAIGWTTLKYRGDRAVLVSSLAAARGVVDDLPVTFDASDFDKVVSRMKEKHYPPGIHSKDYAEAYQPAYRLVLLHHLSDPDFGGREGIIALPEHL